MGPPFRLLAIEITRLGALSCLVFFVSLTDLQHPEEPTFASEPFSVVIQGAVDLAIELTVRGKQFKSHNL